MNAHVPAVPMTTKSLYRVKLRIGDRGLQNRKLYHLNRLSISDCLNAANGIHRKGENLVSPFGTMRFCVVLVALD